MIQQAMRHQSILPIMADVAPIVMIMITAAALLVAAPAHSQDIASRATLGASLEKVTDIKAQPLALLAKFPQAGPAMAQYVAQALIREPSAFDAIISIIPDTSPEQASAIGAGLVRAIRAMGTKQTAVAQAITFKVGISENPWLKATFRALGTSYRGNVPLNIPSQARAQPIFSSAPIGLELPDGKGRVGPAKISELIPQKQSFDDKRCTLRFERYEWRTCRGMIVAMIASDAPSNGAVSTSPTN